MINPYCKHKMVCHTGEKLGIYAGRDVYYCPHGGCAQWFVEYTPEELGRFQQVVLQVSRWLLGR